MNPTRLFPPVPVPDLRRSVRIVIEQTSAGLLHTGDRPTPGAVEALRRLRGEGGVVLRFCSNTTKESSESRSGNYFCLIDIAGGISGAGGGGGDNEGKYGEGEGLMILFFLWHPFTPSG